MALHRVTRNLLKQFRARPTLRAGSLIITVFGDAILPRGGTVWIGSLIKVLADFGVSERLVRTSVFRLTQDDWLAVEQLGRRSYYRLTGTGARKFEQATSRIYGEPRRTWNGKWCLVVLAELDAADKERVRKELGWLGFAPIAASLLAHPAPNAAQMAASLEQTGLQEKLVILEGSTQGRNRDDAMAALVHKSWNLADIDRRYELFVQQFRPAFQALGKLPRCEPRDGFLLRTLLIQEYRKILLRDPLLPAELLPAGWHGTAAYQLCRNLYRLVAAAADEYMSQALETADGPLPPPAAAFYMRFGGLEDQTLLGTVKNDE
jgi:phenylacetic acid degradation operon negative regulatory protein